MLKEDMFMETLSECLSHVAKDMAYSWFLAVGSQCGASGGLFGPFLGHFMALEGCQELVDTGKSSRT